MSSLLQFAWLVALVLSVTWAVRIWKLNLLRRYPVLFTYLVVTVSFDLLGNLFYRSRGLTSYNLLYDLLWVVMTPVNWLLLFALVFEVYGHMLEQYPGVRKLGRLVLYVGLCGLGLVVGVLFFLHPYPIPDLDLWKSFWLKQEQSVYLAIAGLVFILLLFKRMFSLVVSKNAQLVFTAFGLYFAGFAALMVVRTYVGPGFRPIRDLVGMALYIAALTAGNFLFSRAGEVATAGAAPDLARRPEMAAHAARHLQSFNDRLVRVLNA